MGCSWYVVKPGFTCFKESSQEHLWLDFKKSLGIIRDLLVVVVVVVAVVVVVVVVAVVVVVVDVVVLAVLK